MRFRIKKAINKQCTRYYIVQRKGWFFWHTERKTVVAGRYLWRASIKFKTMQEANKYIAQQYDEARTERERREEAKAWLETPVSIVKE